MTIIDDILNKKKSTREAIFTVQARLTEFSAPATPPATKWLATTLETAAKPITLTTGNSSNLRKTHLGPKHNSDRILVNTLKPLVCMNEHDRLYILKLEICFATLSFIFVSVILIWLFCNFFRFFRKKRTQKEKNSNNFKLRQIKTPKKASSSPFNATPIRFAGASRSSEHLGNQVIKMIAIPKTVKFIFPDNSDSTSGSDVSVFLNT